MAMIKCPECGREMSDKAAACPNCGCPIEDIKAQLDVIEAERSEAIKKKEDAKKAKEVAASIRKQKQKEARKAVTPEMKKKRGIVAALAIAIIVVACILGWYFGIKLPKEKAYAAYVMAVDETNVSVTDYNNSINSYNTKAKTIIAANDELDSVVKEAQELIDSGDEPYEGAKITSLSNTVKDARNNKVETPILKETVAEEKIDETLATASKTDIDNATQTLASKSDKYTANIQSVQAEEAALTVPDYAQFISVLETQRKELEDSYAIQKQITAPTEEWVITRLGRVDNVANIAPVTEEHDPNGKLNKAGGYTATVYFMSPLLGTENLTGYDLIEEGTTGGGAIEVYRNVEDAENRNTYLGALDGGIFSSGSHVVLGTMVVRTSDDLKASQQETLTNAIVAAMTELD